MYTEQDLENIIAICDQDEDAPALAGRLKDRCEKALAYKDCDLHITAADKRFLSHYYDGEMDPEAKATLHKILGKEDVLGQMVWISKKALTKGIFEMKVVQVSDDGKNVYGKSLYDAYRGEGLEWHRTKEEALVRAQALREKKISNLKKQIVKLSELDFGGPLNKTNMDVITEMSAEKLAEYLCTEGWKMGDYQACLKWLQSSSEQED